MYVKNVHARCCESRSRIFARFSTPHSRVLIEHLNCSQNEFIFVNLRQKTIQHRPQAHLSYAEIKISRFCNKQAQVKQRRIVFTASAIFPVIPVKCLVICRRRHACISTRCFELFRLTFRRAFSAVFIERVIFQVMMEGMFLNVGCKLNKCITDEFILCG